MTNILLAKQTIEVLLRFGVEEFILCAGARNSPFMFLFEKNNHLSIESFFDERSASFYALGKIQKTNRPVALITTSGTAVSETLSAVIEAHYTHQPLIIVSADRPKSYRGHGAPQSIEHVGIFSHYVEHSFDLDIHHPDITLTSISGQRPIHLNVCFDEPLIDDEIPLISAMTKNQFEQEVLQNNFADQTSHCDIFIEQNQIKEFILNTKPMVILGQIDLCDHDLVRDFLIRLNCPTYAEAISNLREEPRLQHSFIRHGDTVASQLFQKQICNSVLRIGGVPTTRLWRDLESKLKDIPVLSVTNSGFSGLSRSSKVVKNIGALCCEFQSRQNSHDVDSLLNLDRKMSEVLNGCFQQFPLAETSWIHHVSKLAIGDRIYLGNSLPLREWDMCAQTQSVYTEIFGNRGANGIDGQISTMLGWSKDQNRQWGLFGDLTTMYDLNSLWAVRNVETLNCQIVIINNGGGQIFNRMFRKEIFLNQHQIQFSEWAKMWSWNYIKLNQSELPSSISGKNIIEIVPCAQQTEDFHKELEKQWQIFGK